MAVSQKDLQRINQAVVYVDKHLADSMTVAEMAQREYVRVSLSSYL
jgi:S-adenosylmethionine synthetase